MSRTTRINGGPPEAHVNTQSFYLQPEKRTTGLKHDYHIFFITGNPGLISYYHTFLDYLSKLLGENRRISSGVYVYGYSLGGFLPVDESNDVPYGLQQQVEYVEEKLQNYVQLQNQDPADQRGKHQKPPKIILIGHSVGAYILLELIRRHRMRVSPEKNEDMDIVGGILLFPTVTHIAKSPSGMKFSVQLTVVLHVLCP